MIQYTLHTGFDLAYMPIIFLHHYSPDRPSSFSPDFVAMAIFGCVYMQFAKIGPKLV